MRVLQISGYESPGRRFNGIMLAPLLKELGVSSTHLIWHRDTEDPRVLSFDRPYAREINAMFERIETMTSMQSVLFQNAATIFDTPEYIAADIVHLHLVQTGYLSMSDLPRLTAEKPVVWTLHDPWSFTGHCIYPFDCTRWKIGCGECPDLNIHFPMRDDNTALMHAYKAACFGRSNFEVIVASDWMRSMAEQSPLFSNVKRHQIPFGLDLEMFKPVNKDAARAKLGIPADAVVISFRATGGQFKGFEYICDILGRISADREICIVTFANKGMLDQFSGRFRLVELGWINAEEAVRDALSACDIFLMPSLAEAFGVMAIEAMACSLPVVCFEGTSLPEVTEAPDIGVAVPMRNSEALYAAVQRLIDSPSERFDRGRRGRALVETRYDERTQAKAVKAVYEQVIARHASRN